MLLGHSLNSNLVTNQHDKHITQNLLKKRWEKKLEPKKTPKILISMTLQKLARRANQFRKDPS
jgi:hypothetical protein